MYTAHPYKNASEMQQFASVTFMFSPSLHNDIQNLRQKGFLHMYYNVTCSVLPGSAPWKESFTMSDPTLAGFSRNISLHSCSMIHHMVSNRGLISSFFGFPHPHLSPLVFSDPYPLLPPFPPPRFSGFGITNISFYFLLFSIDANGAAAEMHFSTPSLS